MNKRIAKLLRKYARATGRSYKGLKRAWNALHAPERDVVAKSLRERYGRQG